MPEGAKNEPPVTWEDLGDLKKIIELDLVSQDVRLPYLFCKAYPENLVSASVSGRFKRLYGRELISDDSEHRELVSRVAKKALKSRILWLLVVWIIAAAGAGGVLITAFFAKKSNDIAKSSARGTYIQRRHDFIETLQDEKVECPGKKNALGSLLMLLETNKPGKVKEPYDREFEGWNFKSCSFEPLVPPEGAIFRSLIFRAGRIDKFVLKGGEIHDGGFEGVLSARLDFRKVDVFSTNFSYSNLSRSKFISVRFHPGTTVHETDFTDVEVCDVDFSGVAAMTQPQLEAMRVDRTCSNRKPHYGMVLPSDGKRDLKFPTHWNQESEEN